MRCPFCHNAELIDGSAPAVMEEEELLALLELTDCYLFGLHPSNIVTMHGNLPGDKAAMLELIRKKREQLGERLHERPVRYGEGGVL